jgi:hypothetical protein
MKHAFAMIGVVGVAGDACQPIPWERQARWDMAMSAATAACNIDR